jgi:GT2 family glycosyltransferase
MSPFRDFESRPSSAGTAGLSLGAVITTFDSWPLAARCLEALRSWGGRLERILVADDHSPSAPEALPSDPRLAVRINPVRRGFAATLNGAVREVGTDLAVVLDADAYPLTDASEAIHRAFSEEPRLGLLGFRTVDARGVETPSWSGEPTALSLAVGQRLDGWLRRLLPGSGPREVCLHTAALAVRVEAFLAVGGADEDLGFLDVDLDLSMRLRRAGWIVRWEPALVAFHEGGGSPVSTRWRVQQLYRSRYRLLRKHDRLRFPALLRAAVLARLVLELLLLTSLGGVLFRDAARRRDKVLGRRELIRLVRHELR